MLGGWVGGWGDGASPGCREGRPPEDVLRSTSGVTECRGLVSCN